MKPAFPYYGGKTRVASEIVSLMPPHRHYVEPFFGAGSVLLAKPVIAMETVNDLSGDIVHFFRMLRDRLPELERACMLTPHARAEHAFARGDDEVDDVERARRTFVTLSQGRNASLRKTGWAHYENPSKMSNSGSRSRYLRTLVGRFADVADRMLNVSIECRDGVEIIERYGRYPEVLLYVDPPYLASTRSSRGYGVEFDSPLQHERLLEALVSCEASVIVSGYSSEMYVQTLSGWWAHPLSGAIDGHGRGREEIVWSNRPPANQLFDGVIS